MSQFKLISVKMMFSFRDSDVATVTLPCSAYAVIRNLPFKMRMSSVISSWESCQPVVLSLSYIHILCILHFMVVFVNEFVFIDFL